MGDAVNLDNITATCRQQQTNRRQDSESGLLCSLPAASCEVWMNLEQIVVSHFLSVSLSFLMFPLQHLCYLAHTHAINNTSPKHTGPKWKALMKLKGKGCHQRAHADRSGHSFNWCLLQIAGASGINLKGDWAQSRHSHWFQLLHYSSAAEAQVAKLQMSKPRAARQHPANCRHCHIRCQSVADRACGARRCWQLEERACVWYYSSQLMRGKTKPESIVSVIHKSSNTAWI